MCIVLSSSVTFNVIRAFVNIDCFGLFLLFVSPTKFTRTHSTKSIMLGGTIGWQHTKGILTFKFHGVTLHPEKGQVWVTFSFWYAAMVCLNGIQTGICC